MAYTGAVTVGGPPDVRELVGLTLSKLADGPMDNNAYLLRCPKTGDLLLVDAANDADRLLELIGGGPLRTIVTTHGHWDHWQALAEVQAKTGAEVLAHPDDAGEQLASSPHLFTGDSLFPGGLGNTDHDPERFGQLMDDLEGRVFAKLPDATWVYPGHGKDTTLGAERPHIPEWRTRGW